MERERPRSRKRALFSKLENMLEAKKNGEV
jgi:hypothetical protein